MAKKTKGKEKERIELDMETTVADMNIEGFSWYDPNRKKNKTQKTTVSRKEYRAMVRGAFRAMLPMFACMLAGVALIILLAYLWLK